MSKLRIINWIEYGLKIAILRPFKFLSRLQYKPLIDWKPLTGYIGKIPTKCHKEQHFIRFCILCENNSPWLKYSLIWNLWTLDMSYESSVIHCMRPEVCYLRRFSESRSSSGSTPSVRPFVCPSVRPSVRKLLGCIVCVICNSDSFNFFIFKLCLMIVHTLKMCTSILCTFDKYFLNFYGCWT